MSLAMQQINKTPTNFNIRLILPNALSSVELPYLHLKEIALRYIFNVDSLLGSYYHISHIMDLFQLFWDLGGSNSLKVDYLYSDQILIILYYQICIFS